jgi:glycine cleavage system transcriptional repressor
MREYAITMIGHDRPGIIADIAAILDDLGLNLTDTTMTLLRGHFTMTLICVGEPGQAEVETALQMEDDLVVTVREIDSELLPEPCDRHFVLSLYGADRLGIVSSVTRVLADAGGNITELTTRLTGDLSVLVAEVDLPSTVEVEDLVACLGDVTRRLGVEAHLHREYADVL